MSAGDRPGGAGRSMAAAGIERNVCRPPETRHPRATASGAGCCPLAAKLIVTLSNSKTALKLLDVPMRNGALFPCKTLPAADFTFRSSSQSSRNPDTFRNEFNLGSEMLKTSRRAYACYGASTAVLLAPVNVGAATISNSAGWDLSETLPMMVGTTVSQTFETHANVLFPMFDPALGRLTGVTLDRVSGSDNGYIYTANTSDTAGNVNVNAYAVSYETSIPAMTRSVGFYVYTGMDSPVAANTPWTSGAGGGLPSEGSYTQVFDSGEFQSFIGSGSFNMEPTLATTLVVSTIDSGVSVEFKVDYAMQYTLEYNYIPVAVPEPSSIALMLAGVGVLLSRRLRLKPLRR
jgi:hypothetical protein